MAVRAVRESLDTRVEVLVDDCGQIASSFVEIGIRTSEVLSLLQTFWELEEPIHHRTEHFLAVTNGVALELVLEVGVEECIHLPLLALQID